mmetsp:Transcript_103157/g.315607  ORF Transcript_103157/g.315607 Transcript_103157/m.315607 type:complete len:215 (+) Transcript_103157:654-1298(+)
MIASPVPPPPRCPPRGTRRRRRPRGLSALGRQRAPGRRPLGSRHRLRRPRAPSVPPPPARYRAAAPAAVSRAPSALGCRPLWARRHRRCRLPPRRHRRTGGPAPAARCIAHPARRRKPVLVARFRPAPSTTLEGLGCLGTPGRPQPGQRAWAAASRPRTPRPRRAARSWPPARARGWPQRRAGPGARPPPGDRNCTCVGANPPWLAPARGGRGE